MYEMDTRELERILERTEKDLDLENIETREELEEALTGYFNRQPRKYLKGPRRGMIITDEFGQQRLYDNPLINRRAFSQHGKSQPHPVNRLAALMHHPAIITRVGNLKTQSQLYVEKQTARNRATRYRESRGQMQAARKARDARNYEKFKKRAWRARRKLESPKLVLTTDGRKTRFETGFLIELTDVPRGKHKVSRSFKDQEGYVLVNSRWRRKE